MTKNQIQGQLRALLLALGSMALASCARDTPVPPRAIPAPVQSAAGAAMALVSCATRPEAPPR